MSQAGYTPISLYYSTTAAAVPTSGNLANGELAINITDGKLYYKSNAGTVTLLASTAGASGDVVGPASATDNALARFDLTTGKLIQNSVGILSDAGVLTGLTGITSSGSITFSSLTSGRVPYATTAGLLTDSANLLYSGTDLTVYGITVGRGAGADQYNTAVGVSALAANTAGGSQNVAVGWNALLGNTTGTNNTAIGMQSLKTTTTGSNNSAIGLRSLQANTTGGTNTGLGNEALYSNTTASNNTAVGYQAGYSNTTSAAGTFLGYQAGYNTTSAGHVYVGYQAGFTTASAGNPNVAIGYTALYSNTTGGLNVAVGRDALYSNTTASNNTAVGYQAGYSHLSAGSCTFVGTSAGFSSTGISNTFIGINSGTSMTTGTKNTILGSYSGNSGGLDIRTANNYIVLSDGDGNVPYFATYNGSQNFRFNNTTYYSMDTDRFYAQLIGGVDGTQALGNSNRRWSVVYAVTGTINTSDANQKQDIANLDDAEKRVAISIKTLIKKYRFKDAVAKKGDKARIHVGLIAQEVQAAFLSEGLDPAQYALFCSDTWYEVNGLDVDAEDKPFKSTDEGAIAVTRLGLRYDELLAFVIAAL